MVYDLLNKVPITVQYRDYSTQEIYCKNHLTDISFGFRFKYYINHDSIVFSYNGKEVIFFNVCENGSIGDVFVHKELKDLYVQNKVVLDIGANIGDSSIFLPSMELAG